MTTPDPAAVLIAGITKKSIPHGISSDLARHVLTVLKDANMTVVSLPTPSGNRITPSGVRIVEFDDVVGVSLYPEDNTWRVYEMHDRCFWDNNDDPARVAAAIIAATRWAQREAGKR